jgi:hypothetical protein
MHWCSGTVQSEALHVSAWKRAASLIGNPWYSPMSGPAPRSGASSCSRAAHSPVMSDCACAVDAAPQSIATASMV